MSTLPESDNICIYIYIFIYLFTICITHVDGDSVILHFLHDKVEIVISLQAGRPRFNSRQAQRVHSGPPCLLHS
jgi:hypothetical protein